MATSTEVRTTGDISRLPLRRYEDAGSMGMRRVAWGPLWAGNAVTCALFILLSMLGVSFATGTTIRSGAWFFCSAIISFYAGAWTASRLGGLPRNTGAVLHGLVTWALTSIELFLVGGGLVTSIAGGIAGIHAGASAHGTPSIAQNIFTALVTGESSTVVASINVLALIIFGLLGAGLLSAGIGGYAGGTALKENH